MTLTQIKERYTGIQTKLKTIDTDGCLFLCLCSIIEEVTNAPADIIGIIQLSKKRGWLSDDFTVNNSLELLRAFTGKIWKRTEPKKLPEIIKDNEFSIATKGYGHGVGMSQFGANQLSQQGKNYKDILLHYYPGTDIIRL